MKAKYTMQRLQYLEQDRKIIIPRSKFSLFSLSKKLVTFSQTFLTFYTLLKTSCISIKTFHDYRYRHKPITMYVHYNQTNEGRGKH